MGQMPQNINGYAFSMASTTITVGPQAPGVSGAVASAVSSALGAGVSVGGLSPVPTLDGWKSINFASGPLREGTVSGGGMPVPRGRTIGKQPLGTWSIDFLKGYSDDFVSIITLGRTLGLKEGIFTLTLNFQEQLTPSLPILGRMLLNCRVLNKTENVPDSSDELVDRISGSLQLIGEQAGTGQPWTWPFTGRRLPAGLVPGGA